MWAQDPPKEQNPPDHGVLGAISVPMQLLYVSVTYPDLRPVEGLTPDWFRLFDEKVEQKIAFFNSEDKPASIAILVDHSGSMEHIVPSMNAAAIRFIEKRNRDDKFYMVGVDDHVENVTSNEELKTQLEKTTAKGHTALLDGMYLALVQLEQTHNAKKVLLILSDGGDNRSRYTEREIRDLVRESGVQVYAVLPPVLESYAPTIEERDGPRLLIDLCKSSGGRAIEAKELKEIPGIAEIIMLQIRREYLLGYILPDSNIVNRRWRAVTVKVNQKKGWPPLTVTSKAGYYYASNH
jgi:Ca-activated chloride channel family protein